jgi:hypothetical protein
MNKLFTKTPIFFFSERGRRGGGPLVRDPWGQGSSAAIIYWLFKRVQQHLMSARKLDGAPDLLLCPIVEDGMLLVAAVLPYLMHEGVLLGLTILLYPIPVQPPVLDLSLAMGPFPANLS